MAPMPEQPDESSIERVKKKLYARNAKSSVHSRRMLQRDEERVSNEWSVDALTSFPDLTEEEIKEQQLAALRAGRIPDEDPLAEKLRILQATKTARRERTKRLLLERFTRALLVASAVFFLVSTAVASYFLIFGTRNISCENVLLEIRGPASIPSGRELVLTVLATNKNPVPLKDAQVTFTFPSVARSADSRNAPLPYQRNYVGTIESGSTVKDTARVVLLGREQDQHVIETSLEFSVEDSNASWTCTVPFAVTLATAPINMTVDALSEISGGQEMTIQVMLNANSEETIPNVRLVTTYPFGFDFISAEPKPTVGESVWDLGAVAPNTSRKITIRGVVSGMETEKRTIDFVIGEAQPNDSTAHSTILQIIEHPFTLTTPFIRSSLRFGGEEQYKTEYIIEPGDSVEGRLSWVNLAQEPLYNVEFEALIPDNMIDEYSVQTGEGKYISVNNTMVWTSQTKPSLETVEPGDSGELAFSFKTLPFIEKTSAVNPTFSLNFLVRARRISDNVPVEQVIRNQAPREIQFRSNATFESWAVYSTGPFTNTGPHPPVADAESTYTVVWSIKNTINEVTDGRIVGELPITVSWLGNIAPEDAKITFNPVTRKVAWDVGNIQPGTGYKSPPREAMFQVALRPSIQDIGTLPALVLGNVFSGVDSFTGSMIQRRPNDEITTHLKKDPYLPNESGIVEE